MRLLAATFACTLALVTGTAAVAAAPAPLPPPGAFAIFYERSGGFAPSNSTLVVRPGRHAVAATSGSRAGANRVEFRIAKRRVLGLERALRQAGFASIADPGESGCADCFEYEIRYRGHTLAIDESQLPARLEPVIGELESIVSAHAIPPNA
ncbi:MAG TPA: hypothetical protein VEB65_02910 [Solirubrobacterales bacterium]|nr:hypothetical protein [Solirubrobacterales bacterium]